MGFLNSLKDEEPDEEQDLGAETEQFLEDADRHELLAFIRKGKGKGGKG